MIKHVWSVLSSATYDDLTKHGFNCNNDGEQIALMHSELSEALEAYRHGNPPDDKIPDFSGIEAELADVIIRIMNYSHERNFDIMGALLAKIKYNESRPYRHGYKKI